MKDATDTCTTETMHDDSHVNRLLLIRLDLRLPAHQAYTSPPTNDDGLLSLPTADHLEQQIVVQNPTRSQQTLRGLGKHVSQTVAKINVPQREWVAILG